MMTRRLFHLIGFTLFLLLLLAACGRAQEDEPIPTLVPTALIPTPEPTPTAVPEISLPETIDTTLIDWSPQVIFSSPAPGEEALLNGAITIRFDQPMNQASVESAFQLATAEGGQSVNGAFTWPRPDTVQFTPADQLARQQLYRLQIDENAAGENGRLLENSVQLELETVGFLNVSQAIPAPDSTDTRIDSSITIFFNRPVVPLTQSDADLVDPLQISPPVDGRGEWVSTSIYRFVPDIALAAATDYTVTVDAGLTDVTGAILAEAFSWQFTTSPPAVIETEPQEGAEQVRPDAPLTIRFNTPMDRASTEAAISVTGTEAPAASFEFDWADDDQQVTLTPTADLVLGERYSLVVGTSAQAAVGGVSLSETAVVQFNTVPFPAIIGTVPRSGERVERFQRGFVVRFASPMDMTTLEDQLIINPEPTGTLRTSFNDFSNELVVDFSLEPETNYNVTVPRTAADPYGNIIGEPYRFAFTTPPPSPVASFNLPQQVSQLSTSFVSRVEIIHLNIDQIDVALYDLGLPAGLFVRTYELSNYNPAASPLRTWQIEIDEPAETAAVLGLQLNDGGNLSPGIYLLRLDSPAFSDDVGYWQNQQNLLVVADTNLVVKETPQAVHVWATDLRSGQPVANVPLTLFDTQGVEVATAVSDSNGFARFANPTTTTYLEGVSVMAAQPGESGFGLASSVWSQGVSPWSFDIPSDSSLIQYEQAAIYTDRPIYRPGDTVYFKGILRANNNGRYAPPRAERLSIRLLGNPFFGEQQPVDQRLEVTVSPDGTFSGEFQLPPNAPLTTFEILIDNQNNIRDAYHQFTVAEYRRPEFLVSASSPTPQTLRGQSAQVTIQAEYFFGGTAADLPVNWTINTTPYQIEPPPGPFFAFGDYGSFFYEDTPFFFGGGFGEFLLSGEGVTDENGRLTITLPADLLAEIDAGSQVVTVEATVNDISNFGITARTDVVFHAAEVYAGLRAANTIPTANETAVVEIQTIDWQSDPVANQAVDITFYQREWESRRVEEFGQYRTSWQPIDSEVASQTVVTDSRGETEASFVPERGGTYVAVATVTDGNGRTNLSSTVLWVQDNAPIGWQIDPEGNRLELVTDQDEYQVGDVAQVLIQSDFDEPVNAWLLIERGELLEERLIQLNGTSELLELPITADYAPNVFVTVTAVKPVNPDSSNPYADIGIGIAELIVSPEQFALSVTLTPQVDALSPGDTAVYDIRVTDYLGNPVEADLSLALVDLAILSLQEDQARPLIDIFYSRQPYRGQIGSGLIISGEGLTPELPIEAGGFGGGGGGGAAPESVALDAEERSSGNEDDETIRQEFPDTAFWEASVKTDASGMATVEIPLPDTLTTWRLTGKAVTTDTLVGQATVDIVSSLPLLLRPVTPRFFTVGDVVQIGAIVNNNTESELETAVSVEMPPFMPSQLNDQTVTVPANGQRLVTWELSIPDVSYLDFTFRVEGGEFSDATKQSFGVGPDRILPVYRYTATDVVGTAGVLEDAGRAVEAILIPETADLDQGNVTLTINGSLGGALLETVELPVLDILDESCASLAASVLLPHAALTEATNALEQPAPANNGIPEQAIEIIQQAQNGDGGWGWCGGGQSNDYLTADIMFALIRAQAAGFAVPADVLSRGADYLLRSTAPPEEDLSSFEVNNQVFLFYVISQVRPVSVETLETLFAEHRELMDPDSKGMLALMMAEAGADGAMQNTLLSDLAETAVLSATGVHWESTGEWGSLSGDIRQTAVVLYALTQLEPESELLPSAVRWMMSAREASRWGSRYETAWSVVGLSRWMQETADLNASYPYDVNVNLQPVLSEQMTPETAVESEVIVTSLSDLLVDDVNFVDIQRGAGDGRLYYSLYLDSALDAAQAQPVNRGINVVRTYYDADCDPESDTCEPITAIEAGQQVRVELTIIAQNDLLYVEVADPIPAGTEALDPNLQTTATQFDAGVTPVEENYRYGYWGWWYFNQISFEDEQVTFRAEFLPSGTYQYTYFLQATIPGTYQVRPAFAQQAFMPEVNGRSAGLAFTVREE